MSEPVGTRGGGYGLSAEIAMKQAAKYDVQAEARAIEWIERVTNETKPSDVSFGNWLHDGQILCKLINTIQADSVKKVETSSMPFKQMINISSFLRAARTIGIAECDAFETADLYEQKDLGAVVRCLSSLSRAVKAHIGSFTGPYLDINFAAPTGIAVESAAGNTGLAHDAAKRVAPSPAVLNSKIATMNIGDSHHTVRKNPVVAMIHGHLSGKDTAASALPTPPPAASTASTATAAPAVTAAAATSAPAAAAAAAAAAHAPVGTRGGGYGLSAECAMKQAAKYDVNAERLTINWISAISGEQKAEDVSFGDWLKNGQILCKLVNTLAPDSVKKVENSSMPFKQMSNISSFLRAIRTLGVVESDVFETADLYDEKDLGAVIRCLHALSRAAQKRGLISGPFLEINFSAPSGLDIPKASSNTGLSR